MPLIKLSTLLLCLIPLLTSAQAPNYFELDLKDLSTAQHNYPNWLEEISEEGGQFDETKGWLIAAKRPFGVGKLYLSIQPEHLTQDLALSFFSEGTASVVVQLYDADERTLAVDLLAARSVYETASLTSLIIPLSRFPTARHIVLRRLDGEVSISSLSLIELTAPSAQTEASLAQLAALLGDPLAPTNPLIANLRKQSNAEITEALLTQPSSPSRPLIELSRLNGNAPLREDELVSILQVLGLQGYQFNANDFVKAAGEGREEVVSLYLRAGMPINVQGRNRYTPIAEAATSGELRVLELLCQRGADLEIRTAGGNSALWMACIGSHYEAIRLLVQHGAEVNARGAYGNTPLLILHSRRSHNYLKTDEYVRYLLENGANPNIANDKGENLLHKIIRYGKSSMLQVALDHGADPALKDSAGFTAMMAAKYRNSQSKIDTLLAHGVSDWEPAHNSLDDRLVYHVYRNEIKQAYDLLEAGANPDATDMFGTAIIFKIISKRNLNMIKHFRKHGLSLEVRNTQGQSPLGAVNAVYHNSREGIIDYFLAEGLDPNYASQAELRKKMPYYTPLMKAADAGNADRCQRLLAAGADPTVKNLPARTAAMIAERSGYYQLARELKAAETEWTTQIK